MASPRTTIAVSIDEGLAAQVRAEAASQNRPISWVVEALLRSGFDALHGAGEALKDGKRKLARGPKQREQVIGADGDEKHAPRLARP